MSRSAAEEEPKVSKLPERLPTLSKPPSKRLLLDTDAAGRPVVIKRRRDDFQQSIKDLGLSYIRAKAKQPFAGVVPFRCVGKLERFLPVDRLAHASCEVGITVLPAGPADLCASAKLDITTSAPQSTSPQRPRLEKHQPRVHACRSFDQLARPSSPDRPSDPSAVFSPFSELIDQADAKAYPYLSSAPKPQSHKPSPPHAFSIAKREHVSCTCSSRLYLTASLHYQQLFLRAAPSAAAVQHLPGLDVIHVSRSQGDDRKLTLIILFDGVLGDWSKPCLNDTSSYQLRLRPKVIPGLQLLQSHFQLVLVCKMPKKQCAFVLSLFKSHEIHFEAAYRLNPTSLLTHKHQFLIYERVEKDLKLTEMSRQALVVSSIKLGYEDLEDTGAEVLYTKQGTRMYLTAECLPIAVPAVETLPVAYLVPAIQSQLPGQLLPFDTITVHLLRYHSQCSDSWLTGFPYLYDCPDLCAFSTSVVHQVLMSQVLPQPRADCFFSLDLPSHTCCLHERLAWGKGPTIHPFTNRVVVLTAKPMEIEEAEVVETVPMRTRSGFLNLLSYVQQGLSDKLNRVSS